MELVVLILLAFSGVKTVESADFPSSAQISAVTATVRLTNPTDKSEGSGVVLRHSGRFVYILTANHVTEGTTRLEVNTYSSSSYPNPAKVYPSAAVLARSAGADLAILRLTTSDTLPGDARLCTPRQLPVGKDFPALIVGCADGHAPTCLEEKVRGEVRKPGERESALYWETVGKPARGRSGGPLIDRRGLIIGVASGHGDGKGFYTHPTEIHQFLRNNGLQWLYEEAPKSTESRKP